MTPDYTVISHLADLVAGPMAAIGDIPGLLVFSVVFGVIALIIVKYTTNQKKIARAKEHMMAGVYGLRLFADAPKQIFRHQGMLLGYSGLYIFHTLVPLIVMSVLFGWLFVHLDDWYGYQPLAPGQRTTLHVVLSGSDPPARDSVSLKADGDIAEVASLPLFVRFQEEGDGKEGHWEIEWSILAKKEGTGVLELSLGETRATKSIDVAQRHGHGFARRGVSPERTAAWDSFLQRETRPPEPIERMSLDYQRGDVRILHHDLPWWVWMLIISMAAAFGLKKRIGVEI